jgi:fatty-acyl-CoA synthase
MFARGGALVMIETFDARKAVDTMRREQCTAQKAVAAMLRDQLDVIKADGEPLTSMRVCSRGPDAALGAEVIEWFGAETVWSAYGSTEGYGSNSAISPDDPRECQLTTQGRFFEGIEHRVVDPTTGEEVAPGQAGECLVRGLVMRGYYDDPEATARAIDSDGWLHTQDMVSVDENGFLTYLGRYKVMLKVGGENVAAEEIENCIRRFEGVRECCVIGIPDPRLQEVPRAYVMFNDDGPDVEGLLEWCRSQLGHFKVPHDVVPVEALPLTGSGKIDRAAVIAADEARAPAVSH